MQLLVEYGANIELRNVEGKTAMDILKAQENARECIAYLKSVIGIVFAYSSILTH